MSEKHAAYVRRAREAIARATPGPLTSTRRSVYGDQKAFVANHANHYDVHAHVLAVNSLPALLDVVEAAEALLVETEHDVPPSLGACARMRSALARLKEALDGK